MALTILVIRHAEEPGEIWPGNGVTDHEIEDDKSLVIRGWQRAGAWAALFGAGRGGADYPAPNAIYAAQPGNVGRANHGPSRRPAETISALALRLGVTANESFAKGQEDALVTKLLTLSGVVLVCWEHDAIVADIIPRIPVGQGTPPTGWPGHRYDVVLRFDRPDGITKFSFRPLYPQLLSGDPNTPLDGSPHHG